MSSVTLSGTYTSPVALIGSGDTNITISQSGDFVGVGLSVYPIGTVAYTLANLGTFTSGTNTAIDLGGIGTLTNGSSSVTTASIAGTLGVAMGEGGTVVNYGTIAGSGGTAVLFQGISDRLVVESSAVFVGRVVADAASRAGNTLELAGATGAGTLAGLGSSFQNFGVVEVDPGASWTLAGHDAVIAGTTLTIDGTLSVTGSLINAGSVSGPVTLASGAYLLNRASGQISTGGQAIYGLGDNAVINRGSIDATGGPGIYLHDGGTVTNAAGALITTHGDNGVRIGGTAGEVINDGTIYSRFSAAVALNEGGTLVNQARGTIDGYPFGLYVGNAAGTVVNDGRIDARFGKAVWLADGGVVTNAASGTITSNGYGVYVGTAGGTVVNFGTIYSESNGAVFFAGSTGLLVMEAGSTLTGRAAIGNGSTVEFVAAGGSGTIGGIGTGTITGSAGGGLTGFSTYELEGGSWTLTGYDTIAAGQTLVVGGALTVAGTFAGNLALNGHGLTVAAGGDVTGTLAASGALANTVVVGGTVGGIALGAGNDVLVLDPGATVTGTVDGGGGTNLLELAAGAGQGTLAGFGSSITNFAAIIVEDGADWVLNGTVGALVPVLDGGTLTVDGTVSGQVALAGGVLTVASGASVGSVGSTGRLDNTVVNDGTIGAVTLTGGNDVVEMAAGAVFTGTVNAGGGSNELELTGTGGTLSSFGTQFRGFQGIEIAAGASWTLDGTQERGAEVYNLGTVSFTNGTLLNAPALFNGPNAVVEGTIKATGTHAMEIVNVGTLGPVSLGGGNDIVILGPGSDLTGTFSAGGGTNALLLFSDTFASSGTLSGLGVSVTGFREIGVQETADWTLQGTSVLGATDVLYDYGTLAVAGRMTNDGLIAVEGTKAIEVTVGSTLVNGSARLTSALIGAADEALYLDGATLTNFGTVGGQGTVAIVASYGASIVNSGTITAPSGVAIYAYGGASVTNLASGVIEGNGAGVLVDFGSGIVTNLGTILSQSLGVGFATGGGVTNGSASDTSALIQAQDGYGVVMEGFGTVANFGTIEAYGTYAGIQFAYGQVTNGSTADLAAVIRGAEGVVAEFGAGTVVNYGTIRGGVGVTPHVRRPSGESVHPDRGRVDQSGAGVELIRGGTVINGSTADPAALIQGEYGVLAVGQATVVNFGTIAGGNYNAITVGAGAVTNGSAADTTALIAGSSGLQATSGTAVIANYGTIDAVGGFGTGIALSVGGTVTNGSATDRAATIEGYTGIAGTSLTTIVNFGTITDGSGLSAIDRVGRLVDEGGSVLLGSVYGGGGGVLELAAAGGAGTIGGIGYQVAGFDRITVDAGAEWTMTGSNTILPGTSLAVSGTLALSGTLQAGATVSGGGTIVLETGGVLTLTDAPAFTARLAGLGSSQQLDIQGLGTDPTLGFSGGHNAGTLVLTEGTLSARIALLGQFVAAGFHESSDGHGGVYITYTPPPRPEPSLAGPVG